MLRRSRILLQVSFSVAALIPMLASLLFPGFLSMADYITQAALIISPAAFLFFQPRLKFAFGIPFFLGFVWGLWRMAYFDPLTENDIPGIGYIFVGFELGLAGIVIYGIRKAYQNARFRKAVAKKYPL
jgi:hypothetical protein